MQPVLQRHRWTPRPAPNPPQSQSYAADLDARRRATTEPPSGQVCLTLTIGQRQLVKFLSDREVAEFVGLFEIPSPTVDLEAVERWQLERALLHRARYNAGRSKREQLSLQECAAMLGISQKTLWEKRKKYGLD